MKLAGPAETNPPAALPLGLETAYAMVGQEGWLVNRKRMQRLWREEGLKRPQFCRKTPPAGTDADRADVGVRA